MGYLLCTTAIVAAFLLPIKGETDKLALVMVYARRSKYFKWLVFQIVKDWHLNKYLDKMDVRLDERKCSTPT